jgi:alkanesulfonate monooxygenase SsuD/methylene tetrahydromethanopterin reductase-like flavin-dependent oxidoreductase (luciferase family)
MKKIGFLSFGHWAPSPHSRTQSATDALLQSIDLAVEAERLGMDGAYFRVHHFAQQLASPFPLLAAVGAKTRTIEIGTAVIDMRYENPHYMAEDAGAADLISSGRLQLGISRGSPEQVIDGWRYFGYRPIEGEDDAGMPRNLKHLTRNYRVMRTDSSEYGVSWPTQMNMKTATRLNRSVPILKGFLSTLRMDLSLRS